MPSGCASPYHLPKSLAVFSLSLICLFTFFLGWTLCIHLTNLRLPLLFNMKLSLLAAAAIAPLASAHYFFDTLVIDGQESTPNQYVRSNTRPEKYNPTKWKETRDDMTPDMPDFRCNKGAFTFAGETETAEVQAGSKLAMKLGVGATMQHPGPGLVYMSKAPDAANQYEGDGDWFKIHEEGICDTSKDITTDAWCTYDKDRIEFTIPSDVPDGEYLIRPEHIGKYC